MYIYIYIYLVMICYNILIYIYIYTWYLYNSLYTFQPFFVMFFPIFFYHFHPVMYSTSAVHGQDYFQGLAGRVFGPEDMRDSSLAKDLGGENRRPLLWRWCFFSWMGLYDFIMTLLWLYYDFIMTLFICFCLLMFILFVYISRFLIPVMRFLDVLLWLAKIWVGI